MGGKNISVRVDGETEGNHFEMITESAIWVQQG